MLRTTSAATALFALIALGSTANAASFPCGGGLNYTEAAICDNGVLSDLDSRMAAIYFRRLHELHGYDRSRLEQDQYAWLGQRNSCGANVNCLIDLYTARIHILHVAY